MWLEAFVIKLVRDDGGMAQSHSSGIIRSSQMLDTVSKKSLQDLLTVWICGIKEFEESRMTPLVLA